MASLPFAVLLAVAVASCVAPAAAESSEGTRHNKGFIALTAVVVTLVFALLIYGCVRAVRGSEHARLFRGWVHFDKERRSLGVNPKCPGGGALDEGVHLEVVVTSPRDDALKIASA